VLDLPPTVLCIGDSAFEGCTALTQFVAAPVLERVGQSAFYKCTQLASACMAGVQGECTIGESAFARCRSLSVVGMPPKLARVAANTFEGCIQLRHCTLPATCLEIGSQAFADCTKLQYVGLAGGALCHKWTFWNCPSLALFGREDAGATRVYATSKPNALVGHLPLHTRSVLALFYHVPPATAWYRMHASRNRMLCAAIAAGLRPGQTQLPPELWMLVSSFVMCVHVLKTPLPG
jgi:hypothetical protein